MPYIIAKHCSKSPVIIGQLVYFLHKRNDWLSVLDESGIQGLIPANYVTKIGNTCSISYAQKFSDTSTKQQKKVRRYSMPAKHTESNSYSASSTDEVDIRRCNRDKQRKLFTQSSTELDNVSLLFGEIWMGDKDVFGHLSDDSMSRATLDGSYPESDEEYRNRMEGLVKRSCGKFLVLHSFHGQQETDAAVLKG